jgi:imidazole glycerol-phosphate synthase subunit HisF
MLTRRLIVCLDVAGGRVVKGTRFRDLRDLGDPTELAVRAEDDGADEIVLLDVAATREGRRTMLDVVDRTASRLFVPLTVGGGVRSAADVAATLRAGADKVALNSALVAQPELLSECAARFGRQCIVASIDACRSGGGWRVKVRAGETFTALEAVAWASACAARGAGEILLTSIDRDGTREGYDLALIRSVSTSTTVPVIASGGGAGAEHVLAAFRAGADAALLAGAIHDGTTTVHALKQALAARGVPVRPDVEAA